jgi:hypothetical protein
MGAKFKSKTCFLKHILLYLELTTFGFKVRKISNESPKKLVLKSSSQGLKRQSFSLSKQMKKLQKSL